MTSNIGERKEIIEEIIRILGEMSASVFNDPEIKMENWSSSVIFMLDSIALEIEIDWREFSIFVLVVRLEDGSLPSGYYVSKGRPCRFHLQKVIKDRNWNVDQASLASILPSKKRTNHSRERSKEGMLHRFQAYRRVLEDCAENLIEDKDMIFL